MSDDSLTLADFHALLQLQEVDTTIDQLNVRRSALPGHAILSSVQAEAMQLRPVMQEAVVARDALRSQRDALDAEVSSTQKRIVDINKRLYDANSKVAPSDALAMTQEVRHLKERQSSFEDEELAVMEQLETAEAGVAPLEEQARTLAAKMQQAQADIASAQQQIDAELVGLGEIRTQRVAEVPGFLVAEYEKLRSRLGGVAVAPLVGNSCGGCHVSMSVNEISEISKQPESALIHCEACDRLLVRQKV